MASTWLTRLRVGGKLVDAKGVSRLYRQRISNGQLTMLLLAGLVAVATAMASTPKGQILYAFMGAQVERAVGFRQLVLRRRPPRGAERGGLAGQGGGVRHLMIDFRYHVVSLVSVFVALAVGIVLGAGPLGGPIDQQFQNEVSRLTATNGQQKADLESAAKAIKERDDFATQLTPTLVARQLLGRSVALVSLPNTDGDTVKVATTTLEAAGAHVTTHIEITTAWTDPNASAERAALLSTLASGSAATGPASSSQAASPAGADPSSSPSGTGAALVGGVGTAKATPTQAPSSKPDPALTLATVLARDVLTANPALSSQPDADAEAELNAMAKAGMINIASDFTGKATQVVLVVPTVKDATVAGDGQSASPTTDDTPMWLQLATQLDAGWGRCRGRGSPVLGGRRRGGGRGPRRRGPGEASVDRGHRRHPDGGPGRRLRLAGTAGGGCRRLRLRPRGHGAVACHGARAMSRCPTRCTTGVVAAAVGAALARGLWAAAVRRPPGGAERWQRTNHRGEQLTLLEGPVMAGSLVVGALSVPGLPPQVRLAAAVAAAGAGGVGVLDDLAERGGSKGLRGHLSAAAPGRGHHRGGQDRGPGRDRAGGRRAGA